MHSDRSHHSVGLPHSEIRGSQPSYRLLSAYRRFSRPSSPLNAKASIMCPFSLGHAYLTPCGAGHATSGLCGSGQSRARRTTHARRRLDTRDRSRCSIQSCASGRSWLRETLGCMRVRLRTTNTSLVKESPRARGEWGSAMVSKVPMPSRGLKGCHCAFSSDRVISSVQTRYPTEKRVRPAFGEPHECAQVVRPDSAGAGPLRGARTTALRGA